MIYEGFPVSLYILPYLHINSFCKRGRQKSVKYKSANQMQNMIFLLSMLCIKASLAFANKDFADTKLIGQGVYTFSIKNAI